MEISKPAREVRALITAERDGMLCTISKKVAGWPFGSIAPYGLTDAGDPILLISEIAEHTRNLRADARASLLIRDSTAMEDPQAGARATLMGYAMPVPEPFLQGASRNYLDLFPNSSGYFSAHDFTLFQIKLTQVRYIGGFGEIHWISAGEITDDCKHDSSDPLSHHSERILSHMNQDHGEALIMFADKFGSMNACSSRMISADSQGFDLVAVQDGIHRHLRIKFPEPVTTPEDARRVIVEMVRQVRMEASGRL
ncbi:MAG TPA: DUF2470 domain-containing protein [Blastocatellia bacterium]|nr:DUF2470 domain-containing protein [Blastocatellia bacterium]